MPHSQHLPLLIVGTACAHEEVPQLIDRLSSLKWEGKSPSDALSDAERTAAIAHGAFALGDEGGSDSRAEVELPSGIGSISIEWMFFPPSLLFLVLSIPLRTRIDDELRSWLSLTFPSRLSSPDSSVPIPSCVIEDRVNHEEPEGNDGKGTQRPARQLYTVEGSPWLSLEEGGESRWMARFESHASGSRSDEAEATVRRWIVVDTVRAVLARGMLDLHELRHDLVIAPRTQRLRALTRERDAILFRSFRIGTIVTQLADIVENDLDLLSPPRLVPAPGTPGPMPHSRLPWTIREMRTINEEIAQFIQTMTSSAIETSNFRIQSWLTAYTLILVILSVVLIWIQLAQGK